ncbi:hypothetical protein LS70_007340 [Helicobacter sp. MIT 11-5569]|uniref:hypothetical protein n=1 Tax=Helicobacter sp. MIT 11-5569 TaxID=1548151 RepID=UPI00051F900B|nr:hypothetical protein [Helicobacter sp. MIT 11-5569]TLD82410.1 hypothetical protein LS70_007340 [Helicobacter sp. MIT 11-5569]
MKTFFAQIDWIRNTFFFIFYFFLVAGIFLGVIQPALDTFRQTNAKYRKELYVQKQIEAQHSAELKKLQDYQAQNAQSLGYFKHRITQNEVEEKLRIIFENSGVVTDGSPVQEGKYFKQRYIISGKLENITKLKDALILTKTLPGITRFNFPIHIEREDDNIVFSFRLDTYFN